MLSLELLAEQRIAEAQARGELDDLPGRGRPLDLGDDALVPEELRAAYRILKNAGFVPAEVESLRQIAELERLVGSAGDSDEKRRAVMRLDLLLASRDNSMHTSRTRTHARYRERLLAKLGRF